jgi:carbonic anhydrase
MRKLIEGLDKFQTGYFSRNKVLFEELSHGQNPRILFITCSDSRIDPNLITQVEVGQLFVIRNAGNIVPPYGAANGGEGAAIEYAIEALNIEQIIVCGHSSCGAMKGLLKISELEEKMPLVHQWLKHAEPTRRLVKENYQELNGDELLDITSAENILAQLSNLQTYPSVRSRLHQGKLALHGWIYDIESGIVLAYDPHVKMFMPPQSVLNYVDEPEYNLNPSLFTDEKFNFRISEYANLPQKQTLLDKPGYHSLTPNPLEKKYNFTLSEPPKPLEKKAKTNIQERLGTEQSERIYRGSF